jgi:hypothetical protein
MTEPMRDVDLDKDLDVDIHFDLDIDTDVSVYKDVDVDVDIYADADIKGNTALFNIDVEAFGHDSYTELNLFVLTTDNLSWITATGESAVG